MAAAVAAAMAATVTHTAVKPSQVVSSVSTGRRWSVATGHQTMAAAAAARSSSAVSKRQAHQQNGDISSITAVVPSSIRSDDAALPVSLPTWTML